MAVDIIEQNEPQLKTKDLNNNSEIEKLENEKNVASPYQKLTKDLVEDERCLKEFSLGKRIGFYRMRGDLGSGNFAKVKLGYHCLVKGLFKVIMSINLELATSFEEGYTFTATSAL